MNALDLILEQVFVTRAAPRLLRYGEAAHHLGLREGSIRNMVADGILPVTRVGPNNTEPRIDILDLVEYIDRSKESVVAAPHNQGIYSFRPRHEAGEKLS